jgi:hypothetical protein
MNLMDTENKRIQKIINEQGWDDDSVKNLLLSFISKEGLSEKLMEFLYRVAEDENVSDDDLYEEIDEESVEDDNEVPVADAVRNAVEESLGREVSDAEINMALAEYDGSMSDATLKQKLDDLEDVFEEEGGRGVDLAEEIDRLRIAIAARKANEK